jgi:hypothetical protein
MPGIDRLELYRRIRQLRPCAARPFVMAFPTSDLAEASGHWTCVLSSVVPVDWSRLLSLIGEIIGAVNERLS